MKSRQTEAHAIAAGKAGFSTASAYRSRPNAAPQAWSIGTMNSTGSSRVERGGEHRAAPLQIAPAQQQRH
jgi:hypothetical protein